MFKCPLEHKTNMFIVTFFYRPAPSSTGQTNGINSKEQMAGRFQVGVQGDPLATVCHLTISFTAKINSKFRKPAYETFL